ncbi:MAG: CRTAC1 family protein [Bacteroidota bacterium]
MLFNAPKLLVLGSILLLGSILTGCGVQEPAVPSLDIGAPVFTDVTASAGLGEYAHETGGFDNKLMPEIVGPGAAFIDYNNDNWPDILLAVGGTFPHHERRKVQAVRLYENNKDGSFTEVTYTNSGLKDTYTYSFGFTVADYDNDGDEDFFMTNLWKNMLFENQGGRFVEVGADAGITDESAWSSSAMFFDADKDGFVDLYVGNYVDWSFLNDIVCKFEGQKMFCTPQEYNGRASHYYRNNGDGTFTNRTREAGFLAGLDTLKDKTLGVAPIDFNKDGWIDVMVGNDTENDYLFENQQDGTFKEVGLQAGVAVSQHGRARAGMGLDTGVVDSTGYVSTFVGNFTEETVGVYRYSPYGQFVDRATASRIAFPSNLTLTFGLSLLDIDLDTDLDLVTANGHVLTHISRIQEAIKFRQPPQIYLNRGNGVFDEFKSEAAPFNMPMVARGLTYADYDRDGDIDLLFVENDGPARLWRNDTQAGGYLRVKLEGVDSNRDAVGAHVIAVVPDLRIERWVKTGSSFLSSYEKTLTFGLGNNTTVDSLLIRWPSGAEEVLLDIDANQEILVREGDGQFTTLTGK